MKPIEIQVALQQEKNGKDRLDVFLLHHPYLKFSFIYAYKSKMRRKVSRHSGGFYQQLQND